MITPDAMRRTMYACLCRNTETETFFYAVLNFACSAFLRFSRIIVEPKNSPIADNPTIKMKAGSLTAHSLEGNQLWIGFELSKNGYCR